MKTIALITITTFGLLFVLSILFTANTMNDIIHEQEPYREEKKLIMIQPLDITLNKVPHEVQLAKFEQHSNPGQIISPKTQ